MNPRLTLEIFIIFLLSFCLVHVQVHATKIFNVLQYGALADDETDNTEAFKEAWADACGWGGNSRIIIPWGTYYLGSVVFRGPCKGTQDVEINGVLRSPTEKDLFFNINHWITFQNINQLKIYGGGTLDGQGALAWPLNNCHTGSCKPLPISLRLDFVNNSLIRDIKSINSKNSHFNIFSCHRLTIERVTLSAPEDSPNTDGIHVGSSVDVRIRTATIATGDDCIAIGPGSRDIHISDVTCGPGHGISVGSMGRSETEEGVSTVTVSNSVFKGTLNGVQIKTWPESDSAGGYASDLIYDDILMEDVKNPIFINQQYCPSNLCSPQGSSTIEIRNVTFRNISGSSRTSEAVKLECSESHPCRDIALEDIDLTGPDGNTSSSCSNVRGRSRGRQNPLSCLPFMP